MIQNKVWHLLIVDKDRIYGIITPKRFYHLPKRKFEYGRGECKDITIPKRRHGVPIRMILKLNLRLIIKILNILDHFCA